MKWIRQIVFTAIILGIAIPLSSLAAPGASDQYVTMTTVAKSVDNTASELATVLIDVGLCVGICFVIAGFFKIHQYKLNPQQVQLGQGVSLLLIGCGMTLIPLLIPTASVSVMGTAAKKPAQIGGSDIHRLIGSG